jgi:hypothetical protein
MVREHASGLCSHPDIGGSDLAILLDDEPSLVTGPVEPFTVVRGNPGLSLVSKPDAFK